MLKVGLIGIGAMGKNHLRVLTEIPSIEFIGAADKNPKVKKLTNRYLVKYFKDYLDLIKLKPDILFICTPTTTHYQIAKEALMSGINVFIEKPITDSLKKGEELIELAKRKNLKITVGHIERFNPAIQTLKKTLDKEKDEIISINITRVGPIPPRIKDVGIIVDLGTHDIDLIHYISNSKIAKIHSLTCVAKNPSAKEDTALLNFKTKNGILASININWLTPYKLRQIIVATKTRLLEVNLSSQQVLEYSHYGVDYTRYFVRNLFVPFGEPLKLEDEAFMNAVAKNQKPLVSGEDGLEALKIALECEKKGVK